MKNPETPPHLEYNLAGGLLLTCTSKDLEKLCAEVKAAGYEYACVLPFRGLANKLDSLSQITVVHLEDAWNPTPYDSLPLAVLAGLIGYARRLGGNKTHPPILQDAFFPGKATCEKLLKELMTTFSETTFISHKVTTAWPPNRLLLEIHQGLNLTPAEILDLAEREGFGLVFDPSHLLPSGKTSLPGQPVSQPRGEWETQFNVFSRSGKVEVVDINPPKKEDVSDLLKGRGLLAELAAAAKEIPSIDFLRVEVMMPISSQIPLSPNQKQGFKFLKEIGEALRAA